MYNLIIIGGGVAGLMAAGTAADGGLKTLVVEKMEKPARKLRITGKGRCNITNTKDSAEFLAKVRSGIEFMTLAFSAFNNLDTIRFFETLGLPLTTERGGRVFPSSGKAWDVADTLIQWCNSQGAEIQCNTPVTKVQKMSDETFLVTTKNQTYSSQNVLITTGGVSYPLTGSTGDGHSFAYELGHHIIPLRPALVPLVVDAEISPIALKNVTATLFVNDKEVTSRFGDVDFTDRGLAGAAILQLSRDAVDAISDQKRVEIHLDLKSALSESKLIARIQREIAELPNAQLRILLQRLTPSTLHHTLYNQSNLIKSKALSSLSEQEILRLIQALKHLSFHIRDYRPFSEAIITAGGISLDEVESTTMQSKLIAGLYFAGEILDIDADTGGYNIQLALSTARLAAQTLCENIK